jgi:hypothetical protein
MAYDLAMKETATAERKAELLRLIGDPEQTARALRRFHRAAQALSSDDPRFIDRYDQKWVAVHGRDVIAAETLEQLLRDIDDAQIPRGEVVVRYIDRNERVLIL